jgi:hypothetical protein
LQDASDIFDRVLAIAQFQNGRRSAVEKMNAVAIGLIDHVAVRNLIDFEIWKFV